MKMFPRLIAACLGAIALNAGAQQFTMRLSTVTIDDVNHGYYNALKAGVEKRSGGRIKVEVYPASQLGPLNRTIEGVQLGTIQMTIGVAGFMVGTDPRFLVLDVPGLFDDMVHGHKVLRDKELLKRMKSWGNSKGVESLFLGINGPQVVSSHKAIRTIADFNGLKLRIPGGTPLHIEPYRKLGISPLNMPPNEGLSAMQNRVIDGALGAYNFFVSFKYYDLAKPLLELPGSFVTGFGLVNSAFMKSLGPELEAIVREESTKAEELYTSRGIKDVEDYKERWTQNKGELIVLSPADQKNYIRVVSSALPPLFAENPQLKEDYDAMVSTANKYRK